MSTLAFSIGSVLAAMAESMASAASQSARQSRTVSSDSRNAADSAAAVGSTTVVTASGFGSEGDLSVPSTS